MSAPGIEKRRRILLLDVSMARLPKPVRALVYLAMLAVLTVAGLGALLATAAIIGELTGWLDIMMMLGS